MNPADRQTLRAAAALIAEDSKLLLESCHGHPRTSRAARWSCGGCAKDGAGKCQAQRDYEARVDAQRKLLALARRKSKRENA